MGSCSLFFGPKWTNHTPKHSKPKFFVETGTGRGASVEWALDQGFDHIFSVDIHEPTYLAAKEKFANRANVTLHHASSIDFLTEMCKLDGEILFFLDAHFPGSFFDHIDLSRGTNEINWPLEQEIRLIKSLRPSNRDTILIDDLRIYETGPFTSGACPKDLVLLKSMDEICSVFLDTHSLERSYGQEGYVLLSPK